MKKICLIGVMDGSADFIEAEKIVQDRFPLAQVFNPVRVNACGIKPRIDTVIRNRISAWADGAVILIAPGVSNDEKVSEFYDLAIESGLEIHWLENGTINKKEN